jgi:hypothetical protein
MRPRRHQNIPNAMQRFILCFCTLAPLRSTIGSGIRGQRETMVKCRNEGFFFDCSCFQIDSPTFDVRALSDSFRWVICTDRRMRRLFRQRIILNLKVLPFQSILHSQYWGEFYKIRRMRGGFMNNMQNSSDGDIIAKSADNALSLIANLNQCRRYLQSADQDLLREVLVKIRRAEEQMLRFRFIKVLCESSLRLLFFKCWPANITVP